MEGMSYKERITSNFEEVFNKAIEAIDTSINSFYETFDSIIKENDFAPEQEERWSTLVETLKTKSVELKEKLEEKYKFMLEKGQYYDDIVSEIEKYTRKSYLVKTDTSTDGEGNKTTIKEYHQLDGVTTGTYTGYPLVYYHISKNKEIRDKEGNLTGGTVFPETQHIIEIPTKEDLSKIKTLLNL